MKYKRFLYVFTYPVLIFLIYSILFNFQINFPVFQVSDYDWHWNTARTASSILNFKYNLSNFEFPLFDYFKNYGHNSTFQVIPSLNPIYFLSFFTNVENIITIQKILENFIAMLGIYLFLLNFTKNTSILICFSIIYLSLGYNLSDLIFLNKDFFYFPFFLFFLYNFLKNGRIVPFVLYLILLNLVSNWAAILTYPTISFFIYLVLNKNKFLSSIFFSLAIFLCLPFVWVPVIFEMTANSNAEINLFSINFFLNFLFSFLNNFYDSIIYFINGGGDSFIHPYRGTVGPLYIPFFFYFSIIFLLLNQFKDKITRNYIIIFLSFIFIYFSYYFIFSEVFHPMKIRHHITMIPYFVVIFNFVLLIYLRKYLISKYFILTIFIFDLVLFGFISVFENNNFFYGEQNKIKIFQFFNLKISYIFPFLNILILISILYVNHLKKYKRILFLSILMFLHISAHSSWLNKFESRSNIISKNYINYFNFLDNCTQYINKNENFNILINSDKRLNSNLILLSNLNKNLNFRIFPEYEETNSALVGYIHNLIASEHDINKINEQNYFALLNKDQVKKFSKASSLGYFEMKSISYGKINFLGRIGINKIFSDIKINGAEHLLEKECINDTQNLFIYNLDFSSNFAFLSNYKLDENIKNNLFYKRENYKKIPIKKMKNSIKLNLNNEDLKFKYMYLLVAKKSGHILKVNGKSLKFSNANTLDHFLSLDLSQLEDHKNYEIIIKYNMKYIYFSLFLIIFSAILMFIFKKNK